MVYIVDITFGRPFQQDGDYKDFKRKYPGLNGLKEFVSVWKNGAVEPLLTPEQVPQKITLRGLKKTSDLPDSFVIRNGLSLVSEPLKKLIEEFDPGIHQYFPADIIYKKLFRSKTRYFVFVVTTRKKSILPKLSDVDGPFHGRYYSIAYPNMKVVFSIKCRNGAHMWREEGYTGRLFISESLNQKITEKGLKFFDRWQGEIFEEPNS